ncbi:MAG: polyvinyl alcohol dehydrogenase (cytochrome) [Halieaceae bacterium]|jgi:polyvinyl alcohol dehydrogenase (cytochrome)
MNRLFNLVMAGLFLASPLSVNAATSAATDSPDAAQTASPGEALYQEHCEQCHGGAVLKAPELTLLNIMSAGSVLRAMDSGVMKNQSADMSDSERRTLAEHITGQSLADAQILPAPACKGSTAKFDFSAQPDATGWGVTKGNQRFFDDTKTAINAKNIATLELKWAFAFPEAIRARSQPATAGGSVFVGSQRGDVYSLDQKTGCVRWTFSTVGEVRTAIVVEPWEKGRNRNPRLYFGDVVGNVYAIDAITGALIWRDRPDDHPSLTLTGTPALHENKLYVPMSALEVTSAADPEYACCTFRGGVAAYDVESGSKLWVGYTIEEQPKVVGQNSVGTDRIAPSGAPVWNSPSLDPDRGVMYVGTGTNYSSPANGTSDAILAISLKDGSIVWQQQATAGDAWNMGCETKEKINCPPENGPDYDFGAGTILATTSNGKDVIVAGQKSGDVYGLDPDDGGNILWHKKLGRGGIQGGVHFGMAVDGDTVYVPMSDFDGGPRWPGIAKPGMFGIDLESGEMNWFTPAVDLCDGREFCQPGLSAASTAIPGAIVAGAMDGHLRAYDKASGKVLWDIDTAIEYDTTNGATARGGSLGGGSGAIFKDSMMFVNSGYGIYFHMPGNVLLGFGLPDK